MKPDPKPPPKPQRSEFRSEIIVRLAESEAEILAAQNIRYKVFYQEQGAKPSNEMLALERDFDVYDKVADHLIVIDNSLPAGSNRVVGTYRLIKQDRMEQIGKFYTANEYDLGALLTCGGKLLELGRSCVLPEYRTRPVLQHLWDGIAVYLMDHNIDLMFGCGSLHGTDPESLAEELSYLYYYHLAPPGIRPHTLDEFFVPMNRLPKQAFDAKKTFAKLPPLLKGYLRVGAVIGNGTYIDHQFNTVDVCVIVPTMLLTERYMKHYERRYQRSFSANSSPFADALAEMLQQTQGHA